MKETFNSAEKIAKKTKDAKVKITEGETELSAVKESVSENLDILSHLASMDYMGKLNADLKTAVDEGNQAKIEEIRKDIINHQESMKVYASKARENISIYIDTKGEVNVEEFEKQMNNFVQELWGKRRADSIDNENIKMIMTPLGEMDYEAMRKADPSKSKEFTMNPEMAKMNFAEKEPEVKILDMKEFIGKPRSEVMKFVFEKYGSDYHIPGLEYVKFLLENPDKLPYGIPAGAWKKYHFLGSTLRDNDGYACVPFLRSHNNPRFNFGIDDSLGLQWINLSWDDDDRIVLLKK